MDRPQGTSLGDDLRYDLNIREEPRDPPSEVLWDSEPIRCYKINREWAKHFIGAISALTEWRAWTGDQDERNFAVQQVMAFLNQEENCFMFELRQSPGNPCLLEQSFGDGLWTPAFDFSLCLAVNAGPGQYDLLQSNLDDLLAAYDGTVASVAPNMVYDASADDDIRDIALCHAANEIVNIMAQAELEYRRQVATAATLTGIFLGILGVVLTLATAGTATPFYLAVSATIAGGFGTALGALSLLILDDTVAKEAVACCMYDALKGATISLANFEASLDNCGFTGGTNEAQLAGAIAPLLAQTNMYVTFLDLMERSFTLANLNLAECNCDSLGPPDYTFDFETSNAGWSVWDEAAQPPRGEYSSGIGFEELWSDGRWRCAIIHDFGSSQSFERVELDIYWEQAGNTNACNLHEDYNVSTPTVGPLVEGRNITVDGDQTLVYTTPFSTDKVCFNCAVGTVNQMSIQGEIIIKGARFWLA